MTWLCKACVPAKQRHRRCGVSVTARYAASKQEFFVCVTVRLHPALGAAGGCAQGAGTSDCGSWGTSRVGHVHPCRSSTSMGRGCRFWAAPTCGYTRADAQWDNWKTRWNESAALRLAAADLRQKWCLTCGVAGRPCESPADTTPPCAMSRRAHERRTFRPAKLRATSHIADPH